jgi:hypothetical protein
MIAEGETAPDFELETDSGESVRLSDFRGRPVVLYFYPKDNTPGCTKEACGIRDAWSEFERRGAAVLYRLQPLTGRQHQLRVHMAALGSPIFNDDFYPQARPCKGDDFTRPLQLLARAIAFADPVSGAPQSFESARTLDGGGAF